MFHSSLKLADGRQEDYSENLVKVVMTSCERILRVPSLAHIIVEQEKRDGQNSMWNNVGKLVVLAPNTADQEEKEVGHGLIGGLPDQPELHVK